MTHDKPTRKADFALCRHKARNRAIHAPAATPYASPRTTSPWTHASQGRSYAARLTALRLEDSRRPNHLHRAYGRHD